MNKAKTTRSKSVSKNKDMDNDIKNNNLNPLTETGETSMPEKTVKTSAKTKKVLNSNKKTMARKNTNNSNNEKLNTEEFNTEELNTQTPVSSQERERTSKTSSSHTTQSSEQGSQKAPRRGRPKKEQAEPINSLLRSTSKDSLPSSDNLPSSNDETRQKNHAGQAQDVVAKSRRGRPKRVQEDEGNIIQNNTQNTLVSHDPPQISVEKNVSHTTQGASQDITQSSENKINKIDTPIREVTSQRRRAGRPTKKTTKQPILSFAHVEKVQSEKVNKDVSQTTNAHTTQKNTKKAGQKGISKKAQDNQENLTQENLTQENLTQEDFTQENFTQENLTKETPLALSQTERLSLEAEKRFALQATDRLALDTHKNLAIEEQTRLFLDTHDAYAVESDEPLSLSPKKQPSQKNILAENNLQNTGNKRTKGRNVKKAQLSKKTHSQKQSVQQHQADFISGEFGTTHNITEQTSYTEHAALGVMSIIDEAPLVDALLPLVQDEPSSEKTSKKSRRSRRSRKHEEKNKIEQDSLDLHTSDVYLDADAAPIAEGDELSLLEAEETIKQAGKSAKKQATKEHVARVLYVSSVPDEQVEVVITENGVVTEYFVEMEHQAKIRGNIYKGIINNVDTNLQAAFVNFGGGKNGFLQIDEVHPEYWLTHHTEEGSKYPPIQKVLKVGQEVLVQVVKEPAGSKGAFLTTWISLAGRFIVLTPGQEQIGVSRKVEDNAERTRLRELLAGINPGDNMGVIVRTASEGASKANIQNDLKFLKRVWKDVQKKVNSAQAPCLIHQEADLASRAVRDYLTSDITEVWVDSEEVRLALHDLVGVVFPRNKNILKLHKDTRSTLWEKFNILRQLDEVTKREVVLPSGGRLVFDQTEALMAIDINSGKTHGKSNFEAMVFRTNMEAVDAIARHLRLRDIGGQVVIDFIEMRDRGHCRDVEKAMRNAMKRDRARHDVGRLSSFGLLELVRQRTGTSAISISSEPCPHCRGTGFRRNLEWQSQGVLRDIKSKLSSGKNIPSVYVHHVEHEVALYLLNKKRDRLSVLEEKFNLKIEIHVK